MMRKRSRGVRVAIVAVVVLSFALLMMIVLLTPWVPLPGADTTAEARVPVRDFFSAAELARSNAYFDAVKWASWANIALSLVVAAVLAFTGVGRALVATVRQRVRRWWLQVMVLATLVLVIERALTTPGAAWLHMVSLDYGLSTQSWLAWGIDALKSLGISIVLTSLGLLLLVALARRFSRTWFIPASLAATALVFGGSFAYPIVIEPVFNSFTSLPAGPLRSQLLDLAARSDVQVSDVLVADASRRTTTLNAYVSGFGSTKRIVIYDNLLETATEAEVEEVVAHELGHASNDDVLVGTFEGAAAAGLGVVLLFLAMRPELLRRRVGAGSVSDPAIVPVILGLTVLVSFAVLPASNEISRHIEARADAHALDLTHDPNTFIDIQHRLAVANLSHLTVEPVLSFWFSSHPPTMARIGMAVEWEHLHDGSS